MGSTTLMLVEFPTYFWRPVAACFCALSALAFHANAALYDVNNGVSATGNTQAGWIAATAANGVTFSGAGSTIASRDRGTGNTNGPGGDTANNDMWRDFIFGNGSDLAGEGLDITITGLLANTDYNVRLWGWDDSSNNGRTALWNGNLLTFPSDPDPTDLDDYVVAFTATTNGSGTLVLQGRAVNTGQPHNVFVNGFELVAVPEPGSLALALIGGLLMVRRRRS